MSKTVRLGGYSHTEKNGYTWFSEEHNMEWLENATGIKFEKELETFFDSDDEREKHRCGNHLRTVCKACGKYLSEMEHNKAKGRVIIITDIVPRNGMEKIVTVTGWYDSEEYSEEFYISELEKRIGMDLKPLAEADQYALPKNKEEFENARSLEEYTEQVCAKCSEFISGRLLTHPKVDIRFLTFSDGSDKDRKNECR